MKKWWRHTETFPLFLCGHNVNNVLISGSVYTRHMYDFTFPFTVCYTHLVPLLCALNMARYCLKMQFRPCSRRPFGNKFRFSVLAANLDRQTWTLYNLRNKRLSLISLNMNLTDIYTFKFVLKKIVVTFSIRARRRHFCKDTGL